MRNRYSIVVYSGRSGGDSISASHERHVAEITLLLCAVRPSAEEFFEGGLRCINNELRRCAAAAAAHEGGQEGTSPIRVSYVPVT